MTSLIGITGKAGAGKDTLANIIVDVSEGQFERYSFATKLKQTSEFLFGWSQAQIEDREFKERIDPNWGFSPRRAMQLLGTEFGRALKDSLWLDFASLKLKDLKAKGKSMVVSDVRFENEATWIRENGGLLIHIEALGIQPVAAHSSENGVEFKMGDHKIFNDISAGMGQLYAEWRDILNWVR